MSVATLLPGRWVKPVVNVGTLPAYAQTSSEITFRLYWAQQLSESPDPVIYRATTEGTDIEPLVSDVLSVQSVRLDTVHRKMYWGEAGKIRRANLDGSDIEDFMDTVSVGSASVGIALDLTNSRIASGVSDSCALLDTLAKV